MLSRPAIVYGQFKVVAISENGVCPALDFLEDENPNYLASRANLIENLQYVADHGLAAIPSKWSHEVDKRHGIYEFRKGDLRLFYFKGRQGEIAVCTGGLVKKSKKVNPAAVAAAIRMKTAYEAIVSHQPTGGTP